jgi:hypothetical protein
VRQNPIFSLDVMADELARQAFVAAFEWASEQAREAQEAPPSAQTGSADANGRTAERLVMERSWNSRGTQRLASGGEQRQVHRRE